MFKKNKVTIYMDKVGVIHVKERFETRDTALAISETYLTHIMEECKGCASMRRFTKALRKLADTYTEH